VSSLRTKITELTTGMGMLGHDSVEKAFASRSPVLVNIAPDQWNELELAYANGGFKQDFESAFGNGQAFLRASRGLRNRPPLRIEWKGEHKSRGDESVPVDLRVDYVYLISCKYLSKVLHNSSPTRLFRHMLRSNVQIQSEDWYDTVAPGELQALYEQTQKACKNKNLDLPSAVSELKTQQRKNLQEAFPKPWPEAVQSAYKDLCVKVSDVTAKLWKENLGDRNERLNLFWRLLRFGSAPYFVLGASDRESINLLIATAWDWSRRYQLLDIEISSKHAGQPVVSWKCAVHDRLVSGDFEIDGHVEIRWSHGRFCGPPEAKIYLDTDHKLVPGYWPITD